MRYYLIPLLLWLLVLMVMDFKYRKIKNIIFVVGLFYVLTIVFIKKFDFMNHLCGAVVIVLILLFLYLIKGMGAGDVKVGLVIGLFWGFHSNLLSVMLVAFMASMLHAFLFLFLKNVNIYLLGVYKLFGAENRWLAQGVGGGMVASIPFAGYVAVSTIFWMLYKSPP